MSHTPGPWTAPRVYKDSLNRPDRIAIYGDHGRTTVHLQGVPWEKDFERINADANLIGAAPELLDALKAFLRAPSIGSSGPGSVTIEVQTFNLNAARAAIAKAEGRS